MLFDIMVPICGSRSCVRRLLERFIARGGGHFRMVMISSKSGSGSLSVYRGISSRGSFVIILSRQGRNTDTTHGCKLQGIQKGCIIFISDSSSVASSCISTLARVYRAGGSSLVRLG